MLLQAGCGCSGNAVDLHVRSALSDSGSEAGSPDWDSYGFPHSLQDGTLK
jgi:hypothetical protein